MTYAGFLFLFLVIPLIVLLLLLRKRLLDRRYWSGLGALLLLSLLAMAPWDHLAAVWGIWGWTPQQTWGLRIWQIPLEEYLFCLLEATLATTLVFALSLWWRDQHKESQESDT